MLTTKALDIGGICNVAIRIFQSKCVSTLEEMLYGEPDLTVCPGAR